MERGEIEIPEGVREVGDVFLRVSEGAVKKLEGLVKGETDEYLRIRIAGGGCNGLTYKMKFVGEAKRGDLGIKAGGVLVLVDYKSALYMRGSELDYSTKMIGGGFKFSNPNATSSCSCGESFSV